MKLTTEQIKQILDGAPEGATHVEILEDEPSEYWLLDSDELLWHWHKNPKDPNRTWRIGIPELLVENIHDLSDLREILTLRQRVKELEQFYLEAIKLLDAAICPCCDKSGAYYDNNGEVCQCQWCDEVSRLPQKPKGER